METTTRSRWLEARFYALLLLDRYLWRDAPSGSPRFARKQTLVEALQGASPFQTPVPAEPLPELSADASCEDFLEATDGYRRPVVVRGLLRDAAACQRWSAQHLRARLAGQRCLAFSLDEATRDRGWDVGSPLVEVGVEEFLDRMRDEQLYINNSTELFEANPDLILDLELERVRRFTTPGGTWDELVATQFFIGAKHVYSTLHCAYGGNFFLNVVGRKRWTMMDPRYSAYVHPVTGRPFQFCRSAYSGYRNYPEDSDNILFRLPRYQVTLQPGDLLYNAAWWWHEVENLDELTIGCAIRHLPRPFQPSPSVANHRLFTWASLWPASRLAILAHWARFRLFGSGPFREFSNRELSRRLRQGLGREGARGERSAEAAEPAR